MYRTLHNLMVINETVELLNNGCFDKIKRIYETGSPRYQQEYHRWLKQA